MMSNPRHRLMGGLVLGALGLAVLWWRGHFWWGLLAFFPAHAALLWAGLVPGCQWLGRVVTSFRVSNGERFVWLTIDDGPEPGETEAVLDLLRKHRARATFFVIGQKAARHPHLIRRILAEGHLLGNHTQSHPEKWFWTLPGKRVARELDECSGTLLQIAGTTPEIFRSPVGMKPPSLTPLLNTRGLTLVAWTVRGFDGVSQPLGRVLQRLKTGARPGAILLLHEGRGHAPALLAEFLPWLDEEGYQCIIPERSRWLPAAGKPAVGC